MASTPDTNVFIYDLIKKGDGQQTEDARAYFENKNKEKRYVIIEVENETVQVLNDNIHSLRDFARLAQKFGNWEEAEKEYEGEKDNFLRRLKEVGEPETALEDLTKLKQNTRRMLRRRTSSMNRGSKMPVNESLVDKIRNKLPTKKNQSRSELYDDAEIIAKVLYTSYEEEESINLVSSDKNIWKADFTPINELFEKRLGEKFNHKVSGKKLSEYVNYLKNA